MSKKSSARTGSEGDAESTTSPELFTNIYSGSSSCKSKRERDGGPFGDLEHTQKKPEHFKDFLILMFKENEESSESFHSSDDDQELYNLKNDYLEKLNIVRKRLNLVELSNNPEDKIPPLSHSGCKITEIIQPGTSKSDKESESKINEHDSEEKEGGSANYSTNRTDTYELNTILSPSPSYINSADSSSATNIYDLEYNPPKKKLCHRVRTPKFSSASEGNLPYYTKVTLRENLFQNERKPIQAPRKHVIKRKIAQFTKSKGTQCTEEEEEIKTCRRMPLEERPSQESKDINLFPKVIVERKEEGDRGDISLSPQSSKKHIAVTCSHKDILESNDVPPINFVRDSSHDESYVTITTNTTIVDSPKKKKVKKKRFKRKIKVTSSEKLTLWEELRKLHSSQALIDVAKSREEKSQQADTLADDVAVNTGDCNFTVRNITKYLNELSKNTQSQKLINETTDKNFRNSEDTENVSQYITQYLKYKANLERVKNGISFGGTVVTNINRFQASLDNIYYSRTSLISDEDRCSKDFSSSEDVAWLSKKKAAFKTFWKILCPCLARKSSD